MHKPRSPARRVDKNPPCPPFKKGGSVAGTFKKGGKDDRNYEKRKNVVLVLKKGKFFRDSENGGIFFDSAAL
jgi:hypothetical protein